MKSKLNPSDYKTIVVNITALHPNGGETRTIVVIAPLDEAHALILGIDGLARAAVDKVNERP